MKGIPSRENDKFNFHVEGKSVEESKRKKASQESSSITSKGGKEIRLDRDRGQS